MRVAEACRITGIGRSKLYELIAAGEIPVIKVGRSRSYPSQGFNNSSTSDAAVECLQWVERCHWLIHDLQVRSGLVVASSVASALSVLKLTP